MRESVCYCCVVRERERERERNGLLGKGRERDRKERESERDSLFLFFFCFFVAFAVEMVKYHLPPSSRFCRFWFSDLFIIISTALYLLSFRMISLYDIALLVVNFLFFFFLHGHQTSNF